MSICPNGELYYKKRLEIEKIPTARIQKPSHKGCDSRDQRGFRNLSYPRKLRPRFSLDKNEQLIVSLWSQ